MKYLACGCYRRTRAQIIRGLERSLEKDSSLYLEFGIMSAIAGLKGQCESPMCHNCKVLFPGDYGSKECATCGPPADPQAQISDAQRTVLERAASRAEGNVCPTPGLRGAAQTKVLAALERRELIVKRGGGSQITDAGRKAVTQEAG